MPILTTTIGAYPKPDYVPVPNWFDMGDQRRAAPTTAYEEILANQDRDHTEQLDRGVREVVIEQDEVGIDIPTDGEVRREHYIYYHCRRLKGFDFNELTAKKMRDGSWTARVPTITGPLSAGSAFLPQDWRTAQEVTNKPVKITVPGPLTIMDSTANAHYADEATLAFALGDALNTEIRRLAEAGCRWIQVDEPIFARQPKKALDFGLDALARCFSGVPPHVQRVVHMCCGYPSDLDMDEYPKAEPQAYFELLKGLDQAPVTCVSIEDAHRANDLTLLESASKLSVILGLVDISKTAVEPVEGIRDRIRMALEHIDKDRLLAGPDCGLAMLPRDLSRQKLRNMVAAARSV